MKVIATEFHGGKLVRSASFSMNLADFVDEWAFYWAIVDAFNNKKVKPC